MKGLRMLRRSPLIIFIIICFSLLSYVDASPEEPNILRSYILKNPVTIDGKITTDKEWADTTPIYLDLLEGRDGSNSVTVRCWAKNDEEWLYILFQMEWPVEDIESDDGMAIDYHWPLPYMGYWEKSDVSGVFFDNSTFDWHGWDEENWYVDIEGSPPGQTNVDGKASHDGTHYWFEFRKKLDSGDGYDWDLFPGQTIGMDVTGDLSIVFGRSDTWFSRYIKLQTGLALTTEFSDLPVTLDGFLDDDEWVDAEGMMFPAANGQGEVSFYSKYDPLNNYYYVGFSVTNDTSFDDDDRFGIVLDKEHDGIDENDWIFIAFRWGGGETRQWDGTTPWVDTEYPGFLTSVVSSSEGWSGELGIPATFENNQVIGFYLVQMDESSSKQLIIERAELHVTKKNSSIAVSLNRNELRLGESVTINVVLLPPQSSGTITIQYLDGDTVTNITSYTPENGVYSHIWEPPRKGQYNIQAYWTGDNIYLNSTSDTQPLIVTLEPSSITMNVKPTAIIIQSEADISGDILPALEVVVEIETSRNDEPWNTIATVHSKPDGTYTYSWIPTIIGSYKIRSSWEGNNMYEDATSAEIHLTVNKNPSSISISTSSSSINEGESIEVSGSISPPLSGKDIVFTYSKVSDGKISRTLITKSDGTFDGAFEPESSGDWSVTASWEGDELHERAMSSEIVFEVKKVQRGIPGFHYESVMIGIVCATIALWCARALRDRSHLKLDFTHNQPSLIMLNYF